MKARRVLLVDDEDMVRLSLRDMLEIAGYEVVGEAVDGADAIEQVKATHPDVVLMDINMPRVDGIEAAKEIAAQYPVPVVFLTAYADGQNVARASEAGAYAYLVKPCRQSDLAPAIETALARFKETQKHRQEAESVGAALENIKRLSRQIAANPDLDSLVAAALRGVMGALHAPAAALLLAEPDGLRIRTQLGLDFAYANSFLAPLSGTVFGDAVVSGQAQSFAGGSHAYRLGPWPDCTHPFGTIGSVAVAPLHDRTATQQGKALGCLAVFRAETEAFTDAEMTALAALAGELALAFEIAQSRHALAWRLWRSGARRL